MKIYTFFNKQRIRENGDIPIYICIARPPVRIYIQTGLFSKVVFSDDIFPRAERNHKAKTIRLGELLEGVEKIAFENSLMPKDELKALILDKLFGKSTSKSLVDYIRQYADCCSKERTKDLYERTADKVELYDKSANLGITYSWLDGFLRFMRNQGLADNSSSIHLRNIRSVMNWAIRNDITDNYPFRKFKIPYEPTTKRNIGIDDLRRLFFDENLTESQSVYRDIFKLMFYLIGINLVDLLNAKKEQLVNGRLEYKRSKTGKLYSVKVYPEAMEIIERYKGVNYLLKFCDTRKYKNVMNQLDKILKEVHKGISSYYSRHTWATIASCLDIPVSTISAALGHSHGAEVTNIYIDFDQKKVDEANRKVIDYVLGLSDDDTPG